LALTFRQEVPADDHRLGLGVVDVGRDDGRAARHSSRTNSGVTLIGGVLQPKARASRGRAGVDAIARQILADRCTPSPA